MQLFLETLSELSTGIISVCGAVHLVLFLLIWVWWRRKLWRLAALLDSFTRELKHRSVLDRGSPLVDQIDAFLSDVNEVLDAPHRQAEREALLHRMNVLDEQRRYFQSLGFETAYNICRSMIEAYPLAGILGTILAIGLVVQQGGDATASHIVIRFGQAIWSTCAGLVVSVILMFINSAVEPGFARLLESREHVAHMVAKVKRTLGVAAGAPS